MTRTERALTALAFVNFFALLVGAMWLGGDAVNGKIEGGRYILGNHGRYHEVSAAVYHASMLPVLSVLITHPLGMFAAWRRQRRAKRALNPEA